MTSRHLLDPQLAAAVDQLRVMPLNRETLVAQKRNEAARQGKVVLNEKKSGHNLPSNLRRVFAILDIAMLRRPEPIGMKTSLGAKEPPAHRVGLAAGGEE